MEHLSPPPGGDQSKAYSVRVTTLTTFVLVFISLCLRLITRQFIVHQVGWDDYTILLAAIATAISVGFNLEGLKYGNARHAYYLSLSDLVEVAKWDSIDQLMLIIITCLTKVSICLFVLRIPTSKRLIRSLYVLIVALFVVNGATIIVFFAQCRPLEKLWDTEVKGACWNTRVYLYIGYLQGAFAILTDLVCTSLPIFILWKVQLSLAKKSAICGLMALGLVSTACCITRVSLTAEITNPSDESWRLINVEIWAILEQNTGQIAANLPVLLSFYRALQKKLPSITELRSFLLSRKSEFSQVHDAGETPLGTFPVQKTVDVIVQEERGSSKAVPVRADSWYGSTSAQATKTCV